MDWIDATWEFSLVKYILTNLSVLAQSKCSQNSTGGWWVEYLLVQQAPCQDQALDKECRDCTIDTIYSIWIVSKKRSTLLHLWSSRATFSSRFNLVYICACLFFWMNLNTLCIHLQAYFCFIMLALGCFAWVDFITHTSDAARWTHIMGTCGTRSHSLKFAPSCLNCMDLMSLMCILTCVCTFPKNERLWTESCHLGVITGSHKLHQL